MDYLVAFRVSSEDLSNEIDLLPERERNILWKRVYWWFGLVSDEDSDLSSDED